jgi:hypothetical protein
MSMSNSVQSTGPAFPPAIEASELKAARDFLTSFRGDDDRRPARAFARPGDRKAPAVSNGITRARLRSAHKAAD